VCYINKRNNNFNKIKFESLISIGEAASRIGVSIDTLRRWDKSGKLKAIRKNNIRYYSEKEIGVYLNDISAIAFSWLLGNDETEIPKMFYCQDSSIFQSRLERMQQELNNENVSLLTAITGGIGNNSFDHNIGNWPKVPGIFFGYDINKKEIVLADRGQGLLKTLKRVKPELNNYQDAIRVAFTEIISGRAPEERGNGLKFVRRIVSANKINLFFQSGDYCLEMLKQKEGMNINKSNNFLQECLAIIKY
jgi:hypothetical protein